MVDPPVIYRKGVVKMSKISQSELRLHEGHEQYAQMMACMSLLSDAQFLLTEGGASRNQVNDGINHAKMHLGEAMRAYFQTNRMAGMFVTSGGDGYDHGIEKGDENED
jgi:hypothetical protein